MEYSMTFLTLDYWGLLAALVIGFAFLFMGSYGAVFVLFMIYFLTLSSIVTVVGRKRKELLGVYEKGRGVGNVLSNAAGPLVMALFYMSAELALRPELALLFLAGFASAVASITADKFSSEIGVLDGMPRSIFTLRRARKGASGAVTVLGLAAGLLAALIIALTFAGTAGAGAARLLPHAPVYLYMVVGITVGGFLGTLIDSAFGFFEELGFGNKFTSNLVCGVMGGLFGMLLVAALLGLMSL